MKLILKCHDWIGPDRGQFIDFDLVKVLQKELFDLLIRRRALDLDFHGLKVEFYFKLVPKVIREAKIPPNFIN